MTTTPRRPGPSIRRRRVEMVVFLTACVVGVYAFGNAFHDLSGSAVAVSLGWFAVAGVAVLVLVGQMSRVQDDWPRRDPTRARVSIAARLSRVRIERRR